MNKDWNVEDWAKNEIEIYKRQIKESCNTETEEDADDYGYIALCADSALKAYLSLCEDEHSGTSWEIKALILNRLMNLRPLTPITEKDFENIEAEDRVNDEESYRCPRLTSLFKRVNKKTGIVSYDDIHRVIFCDCYDVNNITSWHNGFASNLINKKFPITLPYAPGKEYKVYGKTKFLDDDDNDVTINNIGCYNYCEYEYIITPNGERIDLGPIIVDTRD